jgi:hypothetical protein
MAVVAAMPRPEKASLRYSTNSYRFSPPLDRCPWVSVADSEGSLAQAVDHVLADSSEALLTVLGLAPA